MHKLQLFQELGLKKILKENSISNAFVTSISQTCWAFFCQVIVPIIDEFWLKANNFLQEFGLTYIWVSTDLHLTGQEFCVWLQFCYVKYEAPAAYGLLPY